MGQVCTAPAPRIATIDNHGTTESQQLAHISEALQISSIHIKEIKDQFDRLDVFKHHYLKTQEFLLGFGLENQWLVNLLFQSVQYCVAKKEENTLTFVAAVLAIWNMCTCSTVVMADMLFTFFHVAGKSTAETTTLQSMVAVGPNKLCRLEVERMIETEFGNKSSDARHLKELLEALPHNLYGDISRSAFISCAIAHDSLMLKHIKAFQVTLRQKVLNPEVWVMMQKSRVNKYPNHEKITDILPDLFAGVPVTTDDDKEDEEEGMTQQSNVVSAAPKKGIPIPQAITIPSKNEGANAHTTPSHSTPSEGKHIAQVGDFFRDHYTPSHNNNRSPHETDEQQQQPHEHEHRHHRRRSRGGEDDASAATTAVEAVTMTGDSHGEAKDAHGDGHHNRHRRKSK